MKIKIFNRHSLGIAALLLFFFTPFYSCKKIDTPTAKQLYAQKFFEKPAESSPGLQAIIDLLRTENDKTGFVNSLPGNAGLPVWNKTISEKPKSNYAARGVLVDQNGNYLIPLSNDEKTLSALLFAMKKDGKYEFFCYDNNYAYQIVFNDTYSIKQRENIMGLFMSMSNYVFGITQFKSIPIELFAGMVGEKIEEGGKTKQMFLEPPRGTPPIVLSSLGVIGTEETCVYKFSGQCNCGPDVVTNTSHCNDWWLGCPFCSVSDCQLLIFEEVPGTDPPPTNPNGGTGEGPSNGYPSWGEGQNLAGGPLTPPANGSLPNAPCSNNCSWYAEAPEYEFEQNYNLNVEDYIRVSTQLDQMLGPGDSYTFQSVNPDDALSFSSVSEFKEYVTNAQQNTTFNISEPETIIQQDEKIVTGTVEYGYTNGISGIKIFVKTRKNYQHIWEVVDVTSNEWGLTFSWSWEQDNYSLSYESGGIVIVDVIGYVNYNIFVEGIGTVYKDERHYQIKINQINGNIVSISQIN